MKTSVRQSVGASVRRCVGAILALLALTLSLSHFPTSALGAAEGFLAQTEISVEAFSAYSVARGPFEDILKGGFSDGKFGAGIALNAFFGRNVGVKLDSVLHDVGELGGATVDYSSASVVLRVPTSIKLDPYALAGVGRNWESERWNTHFGIGAAYNLTDKFAITGEYRHIFESRREDYDQIRLGLRYKF